MSSIIALSMTGIIALMHGFSRSPRVWLGQNQNMTQGIKSLITIINNLRTLCMGFGKCFKFTKFDNTLIVSMNQTAILEVVGCCEGAG